MKRPAWLLSCALLAPLAGAQRIPISQIYRQDILEARTIAVVADQTSAAQDSQENQRARLEVEAALRNWGKYQLVSEGSHPDLIMVVRKGHAQAATTDGTTSPPVLIDPTGSGVNIGIRRGQNPPLSRTDSSGVGTQSRPGYEVGSDEDLLDVFLGGTPLAGEGGRNPTPYPLDQPPAWSYAAKDALKLPKIEAVTEFRKAVEAAEKKKP